MTYKLKKLEVCSCLQMNYKLYVVCSVKTSNMKIMNWENKIYL
jgi:hypothetical protein